MIKVIKNFFRIYSIVSNLIKRQKKTQELAENNRKRLDILSGMILDELFEKHKNYLDSSTKCKVRFFYVIDSYWPSWKSVYDEFILDERCDVKVIFLSVINTKKETSQHRNSLNFLLQNNINFEYAEDYDPFIDNPTVVFYQSPYQWYYDIYKHLRVERLKSIGIRTVYIPYGIEFDDTINNSFLKNLHCGHSVHRNAWKVFAIHEDIRKYFNLNCLTSGKHVEVFGLPKFDSYINKNVPFDDELISKINNRKVIAVQIHTPNQVDCIDRKTFHTLSLREIIELIDILKRRTDVYFIVTIHPAYRSKIIELKLAKEEEVDNMIESISGENIFLYTGDYQVLLHNADGLITELSSLIVEYSYLCKPFLYIYNSKPAFKKFTERLLKVNYECQGINILLINEYINMISDSIFDLKAKERKDIVNDIFPHHIYNGKIGKRIKDYILCDIYKYN